MTAPFPDDLPETRAPAGETVAELRRAYEEARAEATFYRDRYLRSRAEMDNFRKRMERQAAEQITAARRAFLLKVLGVMDNLDRALQHQADGETDGVGLLTGLRLTHWQFEQLLQREGLRAIPAAGQPFDPRIHEAVDTVECADQQEGTVVSESSKGYWLGEHVLRPARVVVAAARRRDGAEPSEGEVR